jgi:hypothetical protein
VKQIGLGLQMYHTTHGTLPPIALTNRSYPNTPGTTIDQTPSNDPNSVGRGVYINYRGMLLPYVEQQSLADNISYSANVSLTMRSNDAVWRQDVSTFVCPSDGYRRFPFSGMSTTLARGCYAAVGGDDTLDGGEKYWMVLWRNLPARNRGVMGMAGAAAFNDIVDGTSNTLACMEVRSGLTSGDIRGCWSHGPSVAIWGRGGINNGRDGFSGGTGRGCTAMCVDEPLVDGSVRCCSSTIDQTLYNCLRAICDGNAVSLP